ncbi:MAG: pyruvate dehydrogenase complex dihydrolipoamide acetyltransferase [Hyphomicrobiaceae bacterium]
MPTNILMPALSPTMEEGKLAKWLVSVGQKVKAGDIIAEIETDKATMEVEAVDEGTVGELLIEEGTEKVAVNTPIAVLLEEGEERGTKSAPQKSTTGAAETSGSKPKAGPSPKTPATSPAEQPQSQAPAPDAKPALSSPTPSNGHDASARIVASPLARRLATEKGFDLARLTGSGPHGRIVQRDIVRAEREGMPAPASRGLVSQSGARATPVAPATGQLAISPMPDDKVLALYERDSYETVPHDGMRRVIAQRLTQSKQTIPHFYMTVDCVLDELLSARERINAASPKEGPKAYKLSVNDFVIKALALALQQVPAANATWTEAGMLRHRHSDVGVAVAVEGGLFTPIIRHAELKTLAEISNEMKDLAARARNRRLAPHEYQGGTTSISNLGMYGIKAFDAVINPPHATILAVGAGEKRPVVSGTEVKVATIMSCTLSCDHRVVDGAVGAELLNAFRAFIEDPVRMLV